MTGKIVYENLKHKPMRSVLSFLLIGVPVTLILALVGLTQGMQQDSERRARGTGADLMVRGSNAASAINFSAAVLSESKMEVFLQMQPHVRLVMGVVEHAIELPLRVTGVDLDKLSQMSGGMGYLEGGGFRGPDDMIVDQYYAAQRHIHAGDTIKLMNRAWHVSGVIDGGKLSHILVPIKTLQDLDASTGKVSQFYLKLDTSENTEAVQQDLKQKLPDYPILSMRDLQSMLSINNIQGVKEFTIVVMAIGVVIGFAVVCLSMYMAVLQRTREIGILKSLGGSNWFILRIILAEAVILAVGGTVLGVLMSFGACWLIRSLVPASIPMIIVPAWWPIAGGITLVGALLGALYPGLNAAHHDPIEALAYE